MTAAQGGNVWKGALGGGIAGACGGFGWAVGNIVGAAACAAAGGALGALVTGGDPGMAAATAAVSATISFGLFSDNGIFGSFSGSLTDQYIKQLAASTGVGALVGGATAEIYGGSFGEGAMWGAASSASGFVVSKSIGEFLEFTSEAVSNLVKFTERALECIPYAIPIAQAVWNAPNTIFGLAYGYTGVLLGGDWPKWDARTNSICFSNSPLTFGNAVTMGNAVIAGPHWGSYSNVYSTNSISWYQLLNHEGQHILQGGVLGPTYFPAHFIDKVMNAVINTDGLGSFGGRLEWGPYNLDGKGQRPFGGPPAK